MPTFIEEVAACLYNRYGDGVSSLRVLFPGVRTKLFFNEALAMRSGKPLWEPRYTTIDRIMEEASGLRKGDNIRLIAELYAIYSLYHQESFDSFYFWGQMLISDFSDIDNYMADASLLLANISDIKAIDDHFHYLTPEQIALLERFWGNINGSADSRHKQFFMRIWNSLLPIYTRYRERLDELGLGYTGMIYRRAAENLRSGTYEIPKDDIFAVVGFNALSESEKIVFSHLQKHAGALFFWDYDAYYLDNRHQEAGRFMRENLRQFPPPDDFAPASHFAEKKEVAAVSSPSDSLQAKYVHTFLEELIRDKRIEGKNTAVVLTDESLLLPVLGSVPEAIGELNITMGYPLQKTPAFSLVQYLLSLQRNRRKEDGAPYHADVSSLLNHPYVRESAGGDVTKLLDGLARRQRIYLRNDELPATPLLQAVFAPRPRGRELFGYIARVLEEAAALTVPADKAAREYLFRALAEITKLGNTVGECGVEMSDRIVSSLISTVLQPVRIPFLGEPLKGLQIMGILETRTLDFDNVIMLSMNDDNFPGRISSASSFIPYNLRFCYGLPTVYDHEAVYAYYFYRLLQRARRVELVYCSRSDKTDSGEASRYITQLKYESGHPVHDKTIVLKVEGMQPGSMEVPKQGRVSEKLEAFLSGRRSLSPSSLSQYIACPMKFYLATVEGIREKEEVTEDVDALVAGNALHIAMRRLYSPLGDAGAAQINELTGTEAVAQAVDAGIREAFFGDGGNTAEPLGGKLLLLRNALMQYINNGILPYDASQRDFRLFRSEEPVAAEFRIDALGRQVRLFGIADRIDRCGDRLRVIDYKTGKPDKRQVFSGIDSLFEEETASDTAYIFQTFIYSLILNATHGKDVEPLLYFVRGMNSNPRTPHIFDATPGETKKSAATEEMVVSFLPYKEEFTLRLQKMLAELFDPATPFRRCENTANCEYCIFRQAICKR